jgi:hypothetical protein
MGTKRSNRTFTCDSQPVSLWVCCRNLHLMSTYDLCRAEHTATYSCSTFCVLVRPVVRRAHCCESAEGLQSRETGDVWVYVSRRPLPVVGRWYTYFSLWWASSDWIASNLPSNSFTLRSSSRVSPDVLRSQYNARTGCGVTYGDGGLKGPESRPSSSKKLGTSGKDSGCWFGGWSCVAEGATVLGAVAGAGAGAVVAWPADGRPCRGWRGRPYRCVSYRCEGSMAAWMEAVDE